MIVTWSLRNAGEFEDIFTVVLIAKFFFPDLRQFVSRLRYIWLSEVAVVKFRGLISTEPGTTGHLHQM